LWGGIFGRLVGVREIVATLGLALRLPLESACLFSTLALLARSYGRTDRGHGHIGSAIDHDQEYTLYGRKRFILPLVNTSRLFFYSTRNGYK